MASAGDSLRRLAQRAERQIRDYPAEAAAAAARNLEAAARADTGGDGRLSHGRNLGSSSVSVRRSGREASAVADSPRLWGVLQKAKPARRTWTKGIAKVGPETRKLGAETLREVMHG